MNQDTPTPADSDGRAGGGISNGHTGPDLHNLATVVDRMISAQRARQEYLAGLQAQAEQAGNYRRYDEAAADTHAAADEDLDELLQALVRHGIGAPAAGPGRGQAATADLAGWAAAGYGSPASVAVWTAIGIDTPAVAQQWVHAGFTPQSASLWVEVPDMTPSEAATCANGGLAPVDVERIRRADPGWTRTEPAPGEPEPDWGISA